jgi:hypothetical protein
MVETAHLGNPYHAAAFGRLDLARHGGIAVERQMRPTQVVIVSSSSTTAFGAQLGRVQVYAASCNAFGRYFLRTYTAALINASPLAVTR